MKDIENIVIYIYIHTYIFLLFIKEVFFHVLELKNHSLEYTYTNTYTHVNKILSLQARVVSYFNDVIYKN